MVRKNGMLSGGKEQYGKAALLIFLLIPMLLFIPYYMRNEMPAQIDLIQFFAAKKAWAADVLGGEVPQWNKYIANGMPEEGVADSYIVSTILSFLPLRAYVTSFYIFHLFIGGFFFYKYLRESDCSFGTSYVMALIYQGSTHINGLRKGHPSVIAAICLFPLIMFLVKKFFRTRESKWLFLSAMASGVQMTIGNQYGTYGVLVLFFYLVIRGFMERFPVKELLVKGFLWLLFFLGTYAYALLPSLSILSEYSSYGSSGVDWGTFSVWSLNPVKILMMVYPNLFGDIYQPMGAYHSSELDIELYIGLFVLLLAILSMRASRGKKSLILEWVLAAFTFLYACIAHIPCIGKLVYKLPVLGGFRCSGRMLYLFLFFAFSLAGQGLEYLWRKTEQGEASALLAVRKMAGKLMGITAGLLAGSVFLSGLSDGSSKIAEYWPDIWNCFGVPLLILVVIIGVTSVCSLSFWEGRIIKKALFLGAVLAVTFMEVRPYSKETHPMSYDEIGPDYVVETLQKEQGEYKVLDALNGISVEHRSPVSQNTGTLWRVPTLNAYTAYNNPLLCKFLKPLGLENEEIPFNLSGMLTGSQNMGDLLYSQNDLLSMLGVRYIIDSSGLIEANGGKCGEEGETEVYTYAMEDAAGNKIYINQNAKPVLYFAKEKRNIRSSEELYGARRNINLDTVAYIEGEGENYKKQYLEDGGKVEILDYGQNSIEAKVQAEEEMFLCFSQNYSSKWKVYIDGRKQDVKFVNGLIMGVDVPKGEHKVRFVYNNPAYWAGYGITAVTLVLFAVYVFMERRKRA